MYFNFLPTLLQRQWMATLESISRLHHRLLSYSATTISLSPAVGSFSLFSLRARSFSFAQYNTPLFLSGIGLYQYHRTCTSMVAQTHMLIAHEGNLQ